MGLLSKVFKPVKNILSSVNDLRKDMFKGVGKVVNKVDTALGPVDDIAVGIIGGPGALAAYKGVSGVGATGSLNAGAKQGALTYAGGRIASTVSPYVSSKVGGGLLGNVAGGAAGSAASGAFRAAVTGGDVGDAIARGAINGSVGGAVGTYLPGVSGQVLGSFLAPEISNSILGKPKVKTRTVQNPDGSVTEVMDQEGQGAFDFDVPQFGGFQNNNFWANYAQNNIPRADNAMQQGMFDAPGSSMSAQDDARTQALRDLSLQQRKGFGSTPLQMQENGFVFRPRTPLRGIIGSQLGQRY